MTRQTFEGLQCELLRRGYKVQGKALQWKQKNEKGCSGWRYCIAKKSQIVIQKPGQQGKATTIYYYQMYRPYHYKDTNVEITQEVIPNSDIVVFDIQDE